MSSTSSNSSNDGEAEFAREFWTPQENETFLKKCIEIDVTNPSKGNLYSERFQELTAALIQDKPEWRHTTPAKNATKFRNLETAYKRYLKQSLTERKVAPPARLSHLERLFGTRHGVAAIRQAAAESTAGGAAAASSSSAVSSASPNASTNPRPAKRTRRQAKEDAEEPTPDTPFELELKKFEMEKKHYEEKMDLKAKHFAANMELQKQQLGVIQQQIFIQMQHLQAFKEQNESLQTLMKKLVEKLGGR